jgi:hypothetical protein
MHAILMRRGGGAVEEYPGYRADATVMQGGYHHHNLGRS